MTAVKHPTSLTAACVWVPLFPLKCEIERQPGLSGQPVALLSSDDTRRVWQVSPLARRAGVQPGQAVSPAHGSYTAPRLREARPHPYNAALSPPPPAPGVGNPLDPPAR